MDFLLYPCTHRVEFQYLRLVISYRTVQPACVESYVLYCAYVRSGINFQEPQ